MCLFTIAKQMGRRHDLVAALSPRNPAQSTLGRRPALLIYLPARYLHDYDNWTNPQIGATKFWPKSPQSSVLQLSVGRWLRLLAVCRFGDAPGELQYDVRPRAIPMNLERLMCRLCRLCTRHLLTKGFLSGWRAGASSVRT